MQPCIIFAIGIVYSDKNENRQSRPKSDTLKPLTTLTLAALILISSHAFAQDNDSNDLPWKRSAIEFGYFITTLNSNLRIGTGVGIDIDVEEILGMDSSQSLFRFKFFRRFTENKRHRFDLSWVSLHRSGDNQIARDITVEGPDGNEIEIKAGTKVESFLNLDIFKGVYSYSLFLDDRLDLALEFGLYVMPIEFGLTAEGAINYDNDENITAPLPVIGLRTDFMLTPRWFIRSGAEVFYLAYEDYVGNIIATWAALEYQPWKRVGIGGALDFTRLFIEADGAVYPGIDMRGSVELEFAGFEMFVKYYF